MNAQDLLKKLESLGSETCLKTYRRHGIEGDCFGVKFWDLEKIAKEVKKEFKKNPEPQQRLAEDLWDTHNCDAWHLAMKILVPALMTQEVAEKWISEFGFCVFGSVLAQPLVETDWWQEAFWKWSAMTEDNFRALAYNLISSWLRHCRMKKIDPVETQCTVSLRDYKKILGTIESEIHTSWNDSRYAMNTALIAIWGEVPELTDQALKTAQKIGKVHVDHGDTDCKTPDAQSYILKMVARREKGKGKK